MFFLAELDFLALNFLRSSRVLPTPVDFWNLATASFPFLSFFEDIYKNVPVQAKCILIKILITCKKEIDKTTELISDIVCKYGEKNENGEVTRVGVATFYEFYIKKI